MHGLCVEHEANGLLLCASARQLQAGTCIRTDVFDRVPLRTMPARLRSIRTRGHFRVVLVLADQHTWQLCRDDDRANFSEMNLVQAVGSKKDDLLSPSGLCEGCGSACLAIAHTMHIFARAATVQLKR